MRTVQGLAAIAAIVSVANVSAGQAIQHQIRDTRGAVSCVVTAPLTPAMVPSADSIIVEIRVPAPPEAALLNKLPPQRRDFSRLPISVFLSPRPLLRQPLTGTPAVTLPFATDLRHRRLGVASDPDGDTFVRALFRRGQLKEQLDIVAERSVAADSGEKVTAQTRCPITASDAEVWR